MVWSKRLNFACIASDCYVHCRAESNVAVAASVTAILVVAIAIAICVVLLCLRKRKKDREMLRRQASVYSSWHDGVDGDEMQVRLSLLCSTDTVSLCIRSNCRGPTQVLTNRVASHCSLPVCTRVQCDGVHCVVDVALLPV